METMKVGDHIAVTVYLQWADAVSYIGDVHYFEGNSTAVSKLLLARLVSTDIEGLWVEAATPMEDPDDGFHSGKLLIPWGYIYAVHLGGALMADRAKLGFG